MASSSRWLKTLTIVGGSAALGGFVGSKYYPTTTFDLSDHHMPSDWVKRKVESSPLVKSLLTKPELEVVPFRPILTSLGGDPLKEGNMLGSMNGMIEYAFGLYAKKDKTLIKVTRLGENICGHPGIVHGGLISALFDDYMGALFLMNASGKYSGFTANLSVDYRVPMPAPSTVAIVVWIEKVDGRKVYLRAEAHACDPSSTLLFPRKSQKWLGGTKVPASSSAAETWKSHTVKFADATSLYIIPKDQYERLQKLNLTV
ncbi:HotDog domain-containing protein [Chytridium lagenaria]|nr:HotDog domain-containing protein [Chytridium lagenaria]